MTDISKNTVDNCENINTFVIDRYKRDYFTSREFPILNFHRRTNFILSSAAIAAANNVTCLP